MQTEDQEQEKVRVEKLFKQHRERLDQIESYWRRGGLSNAEATRMLEGTPLKQEPRKG